MTEIERGLSLAPGDVIGVSATERLHMDELWQRILQLCPAQPRPGSV